MNLSSSGRWRSAAGDLLLGSSCHGCGDPAWTLCDSCRAELAASPARRAQPEPCPPGFPRTWTAGSYDATARGLVSAHKERSALGLTRVLGERLALAVLALLDEAADVGEVAPAVLLVPVPSARRAVRERGFDAALALARAAARRLPQARAAPLLVPTRRVADQSGLGAAERRDNLAGAFRVRPAGPWRALRPGPRRSPGGGRPGRATLVVVDDVVTSGASLTEAVRALQAGGLPVLGAATVAATARRTPLRGPRRSALRSVPSGAAVSGRPGHATDGSGV